MLLTGEETMRLRNKNSLEELRFLALQHKIRLTNEVQILREQIMGPQQEIAHQPVTVLPAAPEVALSRRMGLPAIEKYLPLLALISQRVGGVVAIRIGLGVSVLGVAALLYSKRTRPLLARLYDRNRPWRDKMRAQIWNQILSAGVPIGLAFVARLFESKLRTTVRQSS
jgi:hypothetical protein